MPISDFKTLFEEQVTVVGATGALSGGTPYSSSMLVIDGDSHTGLNILSKNTSSGWVYFGDSDAPRNGGMVYDHSSDLLYIRAGGDNPIILHAAYVRLNKDTRVWGDLDVDGDLNVDGSAQIDGDTQIDGALTITGASRVRAYRSVSQNLATAAWTTMIFNLEAFDNLGEYNISTGAFVPQVSGYYQINARVMSVANTFAAGKRFIVALYAGTTPLQSGLYYTSEASGSRHADSNLSTIYNLVAGTSYYIKVFHDYGSTITTYGSGIYCNCSYHRLS